MRLDEAILYGRPFRLKGSRDHKWIKIEGDYITYEWPTDVRPPDDNTLWHVIDSDLDWMTKEVLSDDWIISLEDRPTDLP